MFKLKKTLVGAWMKMATTMPFNSDKVYHHNNLMFTCYNANEHGLNNETAEEQWSNKAHRSSKWIYLYKQLPIFYKLQIILCYQYNVLFTYWIIYFINKNVCFIISAYKLAWVQVGCLGTVGVSVVVHTKLTFSMTCCSVSTSWR